MTRITRFIFLDKYPSQQKMLSSSGNKPLISRPGRAKPGAALQTFLPLIHWLSDPLNKIYVRRCHAKRLKMVLPVIQQNTLTFFRCFKYWRASKLLYWVKSYCNFTEWVDLAYWLSCIRKGLPWSLCSRLVYFYFLSTCKNVIFFGGGVVGGSNLKLLYFPRGFPSRGPDLLVTTPHMGEISINGKYTFVSYCVRQ